MRYLLLADLHANIEALEAVLAHAATLRCDRTVVLGDLVWYGADPNAVIERVRALEPFALLRGNHDKVAAGLEPPEGFNAVARWSITWTSEVLSPDNRGWLASLAAGPLVIDECFQACHGSPADEDAYLQDDLDVLEALRASPYALGAFGHTHVQRLFELSGFTLSTVSVEDAATRTMRVKPGASYFVNPGAVGQPRDQDPRAAFAIFDTSAGAVELHRVSYPIERAQLRIVAAGLPAILAERLAVGR